MVWFKVDDTLPFHAKVVQAGNAAMGLWVRAGAWSAQQLTDGHVPHHIVSALGNKKQAERLVFVGLWVALPDGYRFHQWNEDGRQPTRASVEKERGEARDRMRKAREAKRLGSGEVRANTERSSGDVRSTRPDPARPGPSFGSSVETSGGNATEVDGWRDPNEPPKCHQHRGMRRDFVPDCKPCEHKRKQWEAARAVQAEFGGDPWCGDDTCNPITRRRETRFGSILCPECHPFADEESA